MAASRALVLVGRASERKRLDGLLDTVRAGQSAVLVVRGEAGIGKTALLRHAARQAAGLRVARIAGVEAEFELPFAGLHRLCAPMLGRLDMLAEPQRRTLQVAFGLAPGDAADRFMVALAVLGLLSEVAAERPLLCLVDDAHWLDGASGQVLGAVARRLLAESVGIVFAAREPLAGHAFDGLPELVLGGLEEPDARSLLARAVPGRLDERVRDRLIAETGGNPLALVELARATSAPERAGGFLPPAAGDLGGQVEHQYLRRTRALPAATRTLLLLAAADPSGDATLLWRAAEQLGVEPTAAAAAAEAGLLDIDDRVRFHHPLVRSAVYRAASEDERRGVHAALAEVTDPAVDADRRAWHLATAAQGPDEAVADALERSAGRAQTRGGIAAAAALMRRCVALTDDPRRRAERALAAAEASFHAGAFETALRLLATADADGLDGLQGARAELLRAHVAFASNYGADAAPLLLQAARRLEPFDLDLARKTYLLAWSSAVAAGAAPVLVEVCEAVRALPAPAGIPDALDLLLDGLALLTTDGRATATPVLQRAAEAAAEMLPEDVLRWGPRTATASTAVWDSAGSTAILERQARIVRDAGALAELPLHLASLAAEKASNGDFAAADLLLAEGDVVSAVTGGQTPPIATLRLQALRGREAAAEAIASTIAHAEASRQGELANFARWAAAVLHNGLAHFGEAMSAARAATEGGIGPWASVWALPELVEAAARAGDLDVARDALERLAETTRPAGTDFALGIEARSRALLSEGADGDGLHRHAIERLSRTDRRPELARAHLLYGEFLRQAGRKGDAREQLRTAHDQLAAIGMEAFAERARRGLIAAGGKVAQRDGESGAELTRQERQIATLARDGLTNAEIGGKLFLSPRTVEWHLRKVFGKLGITSRSGLRSALPELDPGATVR